MLLELKQKAREVLISIVLRNLEKTKGKEQVPGSVVHACRNPSYLGSRD
jgi:hypothetical protein